MTMAWFVIIAATSTLSLAAGAQVGCGPRWAARMGMVVGLMLLGAWGWLVHHPAAAVQVLPVTLLARIEGAGGTPLFMFVVGIAMTRATLPRQRRLAMWSAALGLVYLLQGTAWLLQATPTTGLSARIEPGHMVLQSTDYSCVPAACATALNVLGVPTSEAEMARLTDVRPSTGATIIRAMAGLQKRLDGLPVRVAMLQPTVDELSGLAMPALTPLQYEPARRHMVTILGVTPQGIRIADPVEGVFIMPPDLFARFYTGTVVALEVTRPLGDSRFPLAVAGQ